MSSSDRAYLGIIVFWFALATSITLISLITLNMKLIELDKKLAAVAAKPAPELSCPDLSLSASEQYKIAWLFSNEKEDRETALKTARLYIAPICNNLGFYRNEEK